MFMLRSLYTLMDSMTRMFRFLSSGVGVVLLLIGVKLILGGLNVEIGMLQSTLIIVAVLLASVVASAVMPEQPEEERDLELPAPAPKADAAQQDATSPAAARR
ncbi:unnamed protein product [Prorocentrum cordatum]|uniref:Uncharacterized protein n=1 Tax=Prorocentrum cordatum TaxID=2364126 RepID=A0ABN9TR78_9DINO|nr:unnamed protein product [Polarella glacialis]